MTEDKMRLQKYLALCGVASRRAAEKLIVDGRIAVNGVVVTELGTKVSSGDKVTFDGKPVSGGESKIYIALNKPTGVLSSASDDRGRRTVVDLVSGDFPDGVRLYPVGRLDYDTEGLIFLTNDGDFTYKVTHPKHSINKTYEAVINGRLTEDEIVSLCRGVDIGDFVTSPAVADIIREEKDKSVVQITIHEGKNRQVRKMFEAVGHRVLKLKRISVGNVKLGNLKSGKWRELSEREIKILKGTAK
ncbi:MAG: rRNA pseudouridine synthase [Ruminococcaceae bacterium]|nr:rRNA pseudouridine synthase [Oscillospiraceae bacterium]